MKIYNLDLKNFHGFKSRFITFDENFTVLVGDNGSGKTAILEALAISLGGYLSGFSGIKSRHIRKDEIYKAHRLYGKQQIDIQEQYPVVVRAHGSINGRTIEWSREINDRGGTTTSRNAKSIMNIATDYQQAVRGFEDVILPIVSYYSTQRLWGQKNRRMVKLKHNRLEGYENVLDPLSDLNGVFEWMEDMRYIELQEGEESSILKVVNQAITACVEDCQMVRYDVKHKKLMVYLAGGDEPVPFDLLSDGYRSVIGLIADLAIRMAMLNPLLEDKTCSFTPGVVLIDELDLHLHPRWQRRIIGDLKKVFPKVQFIATTHSPFIVQALEPGELRRLRKMDDDEEVAQEEFYHRSIEEISEMTMEMKDVKKSEKSLKKQAAAERYFQLLLDGANPDSKEVMETKKKLDYLEGLYSDDVAYYTFLKIKREAAGLGD